jgi:hypothetical protein
MVPLNKVIAFGDDVEHIEVTYGSPAIARRNVAEVLAELIEKGVLTESLAIDTARALLRTTQGSSTMSPPDCPSFRFEHCGQRHR